MRFIIKAILLLFSLALINGIHCEAQGTLNERLRIDLQLTGTKDSCSVSLISITKEPHFSCPQKSYLDTFKYGEFSYELVDNKTNKIYFSNGFSSLFNEWQVGSTNQHDRFSVGKTLLLPISNTISCLNIYQHKNGTKKLVGSFTIDPQTIKSSELTDAILPQKISYKGNPINKLDILILGDGFAKNDIADFNSIAESFMNSLLAVSPFSKYKNQINFWSICPIEAKSGIEYCSGNTKLGCKYNTLESDRYLYTTKNQQISDIAARTPYDCIIILVNSSKYGGGGIYNDFAVAAAGGEKNFDVMIHEFGHSFAGLGDEYTYGADTDFVAQTSEPWEPNLTYLIQFDSKWKSLLTPNTPIPTPDSLATKYKTGVYEGGGYYTKGVYRPSYNCRMRTTNVNYFCEVCSHAIDEKIKSYITFEKKKRTYQPLQKK